MSNKELSLHPQKVKIYDEEDRKYKLTDNAWFYEEPRGLNICHHINGKTHNLFITHQQLRNYLKRKDK